MSNSLFGGPSGPLGAVGEFKVLKRQPDSKKAELLLMKIHSLVKPIMKKHGWYLPTLAEFFPTEPGLLGMNINRGEKILIRLRPHDDPYSFMPLEESLIGTMLHELTHNLRGPHDDAFFKILDGLQDEYDALRAKGYSGEGFLGNGRRVGEGVAHDTGVSMREARERMLKGIEDRERVRKVLGTGGKLGGRVPETKGRRMGEVLAEAAERRARARKGCGSDDAHNHPSGSKKEDLPPALQAEVDQAERDSRVVVIDLTASSDGEDEDEVQWPPAGPSGEGRVKSEPQEEQLPSPGKRRPRAPSSSSGIEVVSPKRPAPEKPPASSSSSSSSRPSASSSSKPSFPFTAGRTLGSSAASSALPSSSSTSRPLNRTLNPQPAWYCPSCTFGNLSPLSLACEVCLSERPPGTVVTGAALDLGLPPRASASLRGRGRETERAVLGDGWACEACSTRNEHVFWTCSTCGRVKRSSERG
ncbi:hypothetical protein JCM8097_004050 [Rhodosporidiobolus ruineniae]